MFTSVKSKLIALTLGIFAVFSLIFFNIEVTEYKNFKSEQIEQCRQHVENSAKILEFNINQLENNVRSLALNAASFYFFNKDDRSALDFITRDNFKNGVSDAIGGGIWFEPYVINPNTKRFCSYASWHSEDSVINDENCDSEEYNYLQKHWYTGVKNNYTVASRNNVIWSLPYSDEIGTKDLMVTVGASIYDENLNFIGMVGEDWLLNSIKVNLDNLRPTPNSIVAFADKNKNFIIALSAKDKKLDTYIGKSLSLFKWYSSDLKTGQRIHYKDQNFIIYKKDFDNGMQLLVKVPEDELFHSKKQNLYLELLLPLFSALILAVLIYFILTKNINRPIDILIDATQELSRGNFNHKISITKPKEFAILADTFNKMTTDIEDNLNNIKNLTYEKMQMLSDLNIAKEIQSSTLPNVFPPFPDRVELDLYATMKTAKEVGGDFYDFYFIDNYHIVFTIADVSGKGVPAALFMMRAKSILKSTALSFHAIEKVMEKVNNDIVSNNEQNFFVTIGLGVINYQTGEVTYINAGHNPPIIKKVGDAEYLQVPNNIVVGVVENMTFEVIKLKLNPLDTLFLYTDGVTEACKSDGELFGETRLLEVLKDKETSPKALINKVNNAVLDFVGEAEQADDMTTLAITYLGVENFIDTINMPADNANAEAFISWISKNCDKCNLAEDKKSKLLICAEEIFVNVANYAYPEGYNQNDLDIAIKFRYIKPLGEVTLTISDSGIPYNPLEHENPDINETADNRNIGGLGVLMVKTMMDSVEYEYKNRQNVLTIKINA